MPLIYNKSLDNEARLAIWHTSEATDELEAMLEVLPDFSPVKSERRRRELICARILLKNMLGNGFKISYQETGKPFIPGTDERISVAHTGDFVAVLLHPKCEAGLDIEIMNERIFKIASKFVSEKETTSIDTSVTENLYKIWGAKEVVYKIYGRKGVDFKNNLLCFPFENNHIRIKHFAEDINKEYILNFDKIPEYNLIVIYGFDE